MGSDNQIPGSRPMPTDEQIEKAAESLGLRAPERPETSKNERAETLMGRRPEGIPFDMPCELGYRCPVCLVEEVGREDEEVRR